ncbi:MAG TPA: sigma-70 family RNA polymerase sigma factor, partial [Lacipirellulaceae bacterium]|nr:sigma-70 family RNA polymerase sigma factor [Lacipirellulaceae bacterium]
QALELLPDDQRQAIELRYLDQQPLQTIADAMERTVNSVAGLIYRGMKTLQSLLPTEFGELS